MSEEILTKDEIYALKGEEALKWLSQKALDEESRSEHIVGGTNAQALYRKFRENCWTKEAMEIIAGDIKDEAQRAQKRNELISKKMEEVFSSIGLSGFGEILLEECKKQQKEHKENMQQDALKKGMVLYHATPLSKEELDGGVLKGRIERPDLMWEDVFTGVCAFPESKGAYVLKKVDELDGFGCQLDYNVTLTDDRLEGKGIHDVLGYIHGHYLRKDDGFMPTISLGGEYTGEWTTKQDVSIDESKEVTLQTLMENGVHAFRVQKEDSEFIRKLTKERVKNAKSGEEMVRMSVDFKEELSQNPDKLWTTEDGEQRKVNIKSYYATTKNLLQSEKLKTRIKDKKQPYQAPVARELSKEEITRLSQYLNRGQLI